MASHLVTIDPDGDVFIILPTTPATKPKLTCPEEIGKTESASLLSDVEIRDENGSHTDQVQGDAFDEGRLDATSEETEQLSVTCLRASQKHLIMASDRAKRMYQTKCEESERHADGFFHWKFEPIFDQTAFEIVMNIIHGQTHKVPDKVTVDTMAEVAAITDDLQCYNAMKFVAVAWLERMQATPPKTICPDLYKWILIASVFHQPDLFRSTTRLAIMECSDTPSTSRIPIYPTIIDAIESRRVEMLGVLISEVRKILDRLSQDNNPCTFECRSMLLGALIQEMPRIGFSWRDPSQPLPNISLTEAIRGIRNFRSPAVYTSESEDEDLKVQYDSREPGARWKLEPEPDEYGYGYGSSYSKKTKKHREVSRIIENVACSPNPRILFRHQCSLNGLFEPILKTLEAKITGLNISDFSNIETQGSSVVLDSHRDVSRLDAETETE